MENGIKCLKTAFKVRKYPVRILLIPLVFLRNPNKKPTIHCQTQDIHLPDNVPLPLRPLQQSPPHLLINRASAVLSDDPMANGDEISNQIFPRLPLAAQFNINISSRGGQIMQAS